LWAAVVLALALIGTVWNLLLGTPISRLFHDILLFLIALGILVRIQYKTKEGEKEKLQQQVEGETSEKSSE
jgi:Mg2+/citrate symporter